MEHRASFANVFIHEKENSCFDLGTIGWLLRLQPGIMTSHSFFVWINSSARGPFLAPYYKGHWTDPFLNKLDNRVKLVGSTINCGDVFGTGSGSPHVQTYAAATDQRGMELLLRRSTSLRCHTSKLDAVMHGEIELSRSILGNGYQIDSLMIRYDNAVPWHAQSECNNNVDPCQTQFENDGIPLNPYEVLFIKVRPGISTIASKIAVKMTEWML